MYRNLSGGSGKDSGMDRLLGYARVSTSEQTVRSQVDALEKAGCVQVWTDTASGARADRPALDELLTEVSSGDTVVVTRLDRLGRSLPHLLDLVEQLASRDIGLRSLGEQIDTTSATGRLILHVFAALAEFERGINHERTMAGLAAARSRGRIGGRPKALTSQRLDHARQLAASGMAVPDIADMLLVGRSTLYRALNEQKGDTTMTANAIDRVWSIRDAVLKWLYLKAMVDGNRRPTLIADDIATTVEWQADSLTEPEVAAASDWLKDEGYLSGGGTFGHGVVRPSITPRGEALADAGRSVRGGNTRADPQGTTNINISNSTNVAVASPGTTQTYSVNEQIERALAVADALGGATEGPSDSVAEAHRIAAEIKHEAAQPQPSTGRLKQLLMSALTAGSVALGQTAATDLVHLTSQALQIL
jgi:DNA invertase Pin-like site-specific DNA recombinase